jgi:hypothetical protein
MCANLATLTPFGEKPDMSEEPLRETVPKATVGHLWVRRELTLQGDRLLVRTGKKRITIRTELVDKLISESKWGSKYLRVVHHDDEAPTDVCFQSFHPAQWFEAFERAGIPTEDPTGYRSSRAVAAKANEAVEIAEGLIWAVPCLAFVIALIAALVWFLME